MRRHGDGWTGVQEAGEGWSSTECPSAPYGESHVKNPRQGSILPLRNRPATLQGLEQVASAASRASQGLPHARRVYRVCPRARINMSTRGMHVFARLEDVVLRRSAITSLVLGPCIS